MISNVFTVDPWCVHEPELDVDLLGQTESLFALANGHVGMRGNLDEGEPHRMPGTYLNSFFESRPMPHAEGGFGFPEENQTLVNVPNGKLIRLLVDDEPLDVRYGQVHDHQRTLDMRSGILTRHVEWTSPNGQRVDVTSQRLVSFSQRAVAAISYAVTIPEDSESDALLVIQSELFANEQMPEITGDPRVAAALTKPLAPEHNSHSTYGARMTHQTKRSELRVGAAMEHQVFGPDDAKVESSCSKNVGRTTVICRLKPGQTLRIVKYLAYGWSSTRSQPAIVDQVEAALDASLYTGWDGLVTAQREYLDAFWARADIEIDGDPRLQQAIRFSLFHVLQAGSRAEKRAIGAKGLTGQGYDGHSFWDCETFVLPVFMHTNPRVAADALRWRHSTLDIATAHAATLGLKGAAFAWRTIRGEECSGYWPAGTAAFHVNADIADAVLRYVSATADDEFEREVGVDLLVATARLWRSLGHHDSASNFRIDGVTGPDEYSAIADNNVYTNLMAQRNLRGAADACVRHPREAERLGVHSEEIASWRAAASAMVIPFDEKLGVHQQAEGFTSHAFWDFDNTPEDAYPLLLNYPYFDLYRKQVVKQPDLVLAMVQCPDAFTPEQKAANFAYYERITVRDSSLSPGTLAVMAAETGHLDLAYDYLCESVQMDLADLENNVRDGIHLAATASSWTAIIQGLGGMRPHDGTLSFAPRLPSAVSGLRFRVLWRGRSVHVEIGHGQATYTLEEPTTGQGGPSGMSATSSEPLDLRHHDEDLTLTVDEPVTLDIPAAPQTGVVEQPAGRAPLFRRLHQ
ncbi:glycoside hydrolase family 65 protein [Actinomycetospora corticicola]|uniref:Alpha,alpha-trehalose phosphorylase n=1 Tax=Actinomycetospora corticicola TaxID=663602 RepID=A0A7Y9DZL4_9PSEU|nr:alpha,alpha-trehalose phosphorylase [Actinomycetospora corticicola]